MQGLSSIFFPLQRKVKGQGHSHRFDCLIELRLQSRESSVNGVLWHSWHNRAVKELYNASVWLPNMCYLVFLSPHGINLSFTVPGVFGWIRQFLILTGILQRQYQLDGQNSALHRGPHSCKSIYMKQCCILCTHTVCGHYVSGVSFWTEVSGRTKVHCNVLVSTMKAWLTPKTDIWNWYLFTVIMKIWILKCIIISNGMYQSTIWCYFILLLHHIYLTTSAVLDNYFQTNSVYFIFFINWHSVTAIEKN